MTKYEVAQRLRDARLAAGAYSVSVTGILIGCFLYDVLNPAVGWLRRS